MIKDVVRDFIICFSLANLIMMKVWVQLLPFTTGKSFYLAHSPANSYLVAMLNTIVIAVIILIIVILSKKWQFTKVYSWLTIYTLTACMVLDSFRIYIKWSIRRTFTLYSTGSVLLVLVIGMLLIIGGIFLTRRYLHSFTKYRAASLLVAPFIFVTFGQSVMAIWQAEPESSFLPHERLSSTENKRAVPVIWIVFDEFDYGIAFERRPKNLFLPELDSFKQECLACTNAFSPSLVGTEVAIPALLTGIPLEKTVPFNSRSMRLTAKNGGTSRLETASTIFTDMKERSNTTAIFGWIFPYARIFTDAENVHDYLSFDVVSNNLMSIMLMQARSLLESVSFSPFGESLSYVEHVTTYGLMHTDVINYLKNGSAGFTFLHYPIPHSPYIYNRHTKKIGSNTNLQEGYLDNLALVDKTLGEIRLTMKHADIWDRALVIVSSDHHWRFNTFDGIKDTRIPFMVKVPYQKNTVMFKEHFDTIHTREMITQILDRRLKTAEDIVSWMRKK